jgi:hypothetical protein
LAFGVVAVAGAAWVAGCSDHSTPLVPNCSAAGATCSSTSSKTSSASSSNSSSSSGSQGDAGANYTYTLIDDMETTSHGPIQLAGIMSPQSPGYWFNFGASKAEDAGPPLDMATPPIQMFTFSALPTPTTTLNGKTSAHAAHQSCTLNVLYDVCGVGMEFAQVPETDAGTDAGGADDAGDAGDAGDASHAGDAGDAGHAADAGDAGGSVDATVADAGADGDAGASVPMTTVPFDISKYKGISFWGRTDLDDGSGIDLKVLFPDTDTDPRGGVCNSAAARASGPTDLSQCYNSYAVHVNLTSNWTQFKVLFSDLAIDGSFGFQGAQPWSGTNVYGINWQEQDNNSDDPTNQPMDLWIDDVYFIQ